MKQITYILFLGFFVLFAASCKQFNSTAISAQDMDTTRLRTILDSMEVEKKSGSNCSFCDSAIANFNDTTLARCYPQFVFLAYQKVILCHWKTKDYLGKLPYNHQFDLLARKVNNDTLLAWSYLWEGSTLYNIGNKQAAYPLFLRSLPVFERLNINEGRYMAAGFLQYYSADEGDYEKQLMYMRMRLARPLNKHGYCEILFAISNIYSRYGKPDSALFYAQKYLDESKMKEHPVDSVTVLLAAAGYSYAVTKNAASSGTYIDEARELLESDKYAAKAGDYITLAKLNLQLGNINEAPADLQHAGLLLLSDPDSVLYLPDLYKTYVQLYRLRNDIAGINRYNLLYESSTLALQKRSDAENNKVVMQVYEYGKKELENAQAEQQKAFARAEEIKTQQRQKYIVIAVTFALMIITFLIFKNYLNQKKARKLSDAQKMEVQEKNKQITESIRYALRIQNAILPSDKLVKEYLSNSFVLYMPKDIVAGDFYWIETINNGVLFAACDCTGHGVPGAMVSVMCHNALNRAVREYGLTTPAGILDKVVELVQDNFTKSEDEIQDGMDASLCAYYPESRILQWAGANNPLWIVRKGEIIEYKPDKQPIGRYAYRKPYTNHEIELQQGDCIYIFTDGYADQFGVNNKKLTKKGLRAILLSMENKPMPAQREELISRHLQWKGEGEQIDDICVIGVKVS